MLEALLLTRSKDLWLPPELNWQTTRCNQGRSTDDAARAVHKELIRARDSRRLVVAMNLDIWNALNLVNLSVISLAFERLGLPPYLHRILETYLRV